MNKLQIAITLLIMCFLVSCNDNGIPYLIYFDSENVLYKANEETGILESRIQIPQDFPGHSDYVRYGEMELDKANFELKQNIAIYDDSIVAIFDIRNSGCLQVEPKGKFDDGTLFLDYEFINSGCKEEQIYRLKYVIKNDLDIKAIKFSNRDEVELKR